MNTRTWWLATFVLSVGTAISGAAIITQPSTEGGWTSTDTDGNLPNGALSTLVDYGDGHNPAGQVTYNAGFTPGSDLIFNNTAIVLLGNGGLTGNFTTFGVRSLTAEFYAFQDFGVDPWDFRLYMEAGGGTIWYYDLGTQSAGWNPISANIVHISDPVASYFGGWYNLDGGTLLEFQEDIANVTRLGFELNYVPNALNTFGFDNFILYDTYFVPEPETYLMLAVALASLAFVFREQLRESIRTVVASAAG